MSILKRNVVEETSLDFRLRKIGETRTYLLDEIRHNDLMSGKYQKTCEYLNYVEHLAILYLTITAFVSISGLASLVCVLVGILCSALGAKSCAITWGIKNISQL